MPELTISPSNANAQALVSGRGNAAPANEAGNTDAASGSQASFAAVLKSKSEKPAAPSGKDTAPAKETESTATEPDAATPAASPAVAAIPATPADPAALLALLKADSPAPAMQTDASAMAAPVLTAAPLLVSASPVPTAPVATPTTAPSPAVSPAPTFLGGGLHGTDSNENGKPGKRSAGTGLDRGVMEPETTTAHSAPRDKLAVETAIPAAASKTDVGATPADSNQESFRSVMERMSTGASGLATQAAGATGQATSPAPASLKMETPLGQAGWHDEMGQKLTWMVNNTRQQAELVLTPPHLGRIEVSLTLDGSQASASFTSPHAAVREALEDSMSRLRGVLADAGISLGQTHVGADPRQDSNATKPEAGRTAFGRPSGELAVTAGARPGGNASLTGRGMVDTFA